MRQEWNVPPLAHHCHRLTCRRPREALGASEPSLGNAPDVTQPLASRRSKQKSGNRESDFALGHMFGCSQVRPLPPGAVSALPKEAQASPRGREGILGVISKERFQLQVTENQIHARSSGRAGVHLRRLEAGSPRLGRWPSNVSNFENRLSPLRLL